ncbi:MAG: LPS export ABC transporter periplasmic protein LptC, partial [Nitrospira sp.]
PQRSPFPARERLRAYRPKRMRAIRVIKVSLTVLAAGLIALLVLWPQLPVSTDRLRIAFADLDVTGDDLSMINARYVGTDGNRRPFSITADAARQPVPGHGILKLESPQADIHLQDGSWVMVTAKEGDYNDEDHMLTVTGAVRLFHDSGYEFLSSEANIDLEQNVVSGSNRITGQGPFGELEGEGFRFSKDGKTLVLTGKSRLKIYPGAFGAQT